MGVSLDRRRTPRILKAKCERGSPVRCHGAKADGDQECFRRDLGDNGDDFRGFSEGRRLPTQGESVVRGIEPTGLQLRERERSPDVDFLSVSLPLPAVNATLRGHILLTFQEHKLWTSPKPVTMRA